MHDDRYRSFIVRIWMPGGDGGAVRIEIERIQSGMRTVLHGVVAEQVVAAIDPVAGGGPVPDPSPATVIAAIPEGSAT